MYLPRPWLNPRPWASRGLERDRTASLESTLSDAEAEAAAQAALISQLTSDLDISQTALADAQTQITGFEAHSSYPFVGLKGVMYILLIYLIALAIYLQEMTLRKKFQK